MTRILLSLLACLSAHAQTNNTTGLWTPSLTYVIMDTNWMGGGYTNISGTNHLIQYAQPVTNLWVAFERNNRFYNAPVDSMTGIINSNIIRLTPLPVL